MALSGLHVECGYAAVRGNSTVFSPIWSETVALGSPTTQSASNASGTNPPDGKLVFRIRASAESYVAVGAAPDASQAIGTGNSSRAHFAAGDIRDIEAKQGQKVVGVAA